MYLGEKHLATKTKAITQLGQTIYTYMKSHLGIIFVIIYSNWKAFEED